jgi:4'-phosphopantetheinyl transferase
VIRSGSCAVWWAPVEAFRPDLLSLLDEVEHDKRSRLRRRADRVRTALGAAVLRLVVQECTGARATEVLVDRTCSTCLRPHGPPRLPGSGLWASISHSGRWVAVAVTDVAEVGVDVEEIVDSRGASLAAVVLPDDEQAALSAPRDFFVCWTRKESLLKATGEGLSVSMRHLSTGLPGESAVLGRHPSRPGLRAQLFDLQPRDGHVAALTVLTGDRITVQERDAGILLPDRAAPLGVR